MSSPASAIGIGITTKDRWDDLAATLEHLRATGLDKHETLVVDDGSSVPLTDEFRQRFPWVKFERYEKSKGLIVQRNYIARSLKSPFYLSIDDDSFPVIGDLDAAAAWLEAHPKVAVIGFRIILKHQDTPTAVPTGEPIPTRDFTGCGFLVRRELFVSLGGFEERFKMYCEEGEYALRAVSQGYEIYFYQGVVVRHMLSVHGRVAKARAFLLIRNNVLTALWYYPFPFSLVWGLWWTAFKVPFHRKLSLDERFNLLLGGLQGWVLFPQWTGKPRLSRPQFRDWRSKPFLAQL